MAARATTGRASSGAGTSPSTVSLRSLHGRRQAVESTCRRRRRRAACGYPRGVRSQNSIDRLRRVIAAAGEADTERQHLWWDRSRRSDLTQRPRRSHEQADLQHQNHRGAGLKRDEHAPHASAAASGAHGASALVERLGLRSRHACGRPQSKARTGPRMPSACRPPARGHSCGSRQDRRSLHPTSAARPRPRRPARGRRRRPRPIPARSRS